MTVFWLPEAAAEAATHQVTLAEEAEAEAMEARFPSRELFFRLSLKRVPEVETGWG